MAEVIVNTGEVQLRTCKLTKGILKQMPTMTYRDLVNKNILLGSEKDGEEENKNLEQSVIGWVCGSVLNDRGSTGTWLIIKTGEGQYGRFDAHFEHRKRFKQIYIV